MVFSKKYIIDNGSFSINFNGTSKNENLDEKSIKEFANKYLSGKPKINNEKDFIEEIINIFRDFSESDLKIIILNNEKSSFFKYKNFNLVEYKLIDNKTDKETMEINYSDENGIDIKYNNKRAQKDDTNLKFHIQYYLNDALGRINEFSFIKPKFITIDQQILIKIYQYFYNKMPDFSSNNIENEFQTMMYILKEYYIGLEEKYNFDCINGKPRSYYIHKLLDGLYLSKITLKNLISNKRNEPLNKDLIELIGNEINEYLKQFKEEEKINELNKICSIINAKKHKVGAWGEPEDVIGKTCIECSKTDIDNTFKLIKRINTKKS